MHHSKLSMAVGTLGLMALGLPAPSQGAGEWFVQWADLEAEMTRQRSEACQRLAQRLGSVSEDSCRRAELGLTGARSVKEMPLLVREFHPLPERLPRGRVLLFGGIHGDELSSVSILFKWIETLDQYHSGLFHWRIVPVLNPDGLLKRPAQRVNANGVDLNRNFPSPDWQREAHQYWIQKTYRNSRRFPGSGPLSEPESRWLASEIESFRPDVIVAVHAPLEVLDFDGPPDPPKKLGPLWLNQLGTYPGSLGRWAGEHLGLPVVTIELPSAGIMPTPAQQREVWVDLVGWLQRRLPQPQLRSAPLAR
jgi:hypothetical protein